MLSDEEILAAIRTCPPVKHDYAGWVRELRILWGRAIESAATAPLLARIAELEAENFKVSAALNYRKDKCAVLTRELEEARKDAERYRWLCGFSSVSMPELTWSRRAGIPKNKLDAAIDAAIKEQT